MRKLFILIPLAALLLPSCNKNKDWQEEQEFSFVADAGAASLKTALGEKDASDNYPVLWSEGDVISINGELSKSLPSDAAGASSATFTFPSRPADASVYNIVYPGNASGKVVFPSTQNYIDGTFCPGAAPLVGQTSDLDAGASLRTCAAAVRFTIKGSVTLTSMEVTAPAGEKISGEFSLEGNALVPSSGASSSMTFSFGEGVTLNESGKTVVFTVPGGEYSHGIRALAHASDGTSMALAFIPKGGTLSKATVCAFPEINYQAGKEIIFNSTDALSAEVTDLEETAANPDMQAENAAASVSLKVGTYNIWAPSARYGYIDPSGSNYDAYGDAHVSEQRLWANSYEAVADMINLLDCDVIGLQEVDKRVYKTTLTSGNADYDGNVHTLNSLLPNYSWVIYNSANTTYDDWTNNTTANGLGVTDAILYKSSVLTLVSKGRYWLNGTRKKAPQEADWDGIGTNRPATWAKFTHEASGRQFVFLVTHLDLPSAGEDSDPGMPQRRNATELIDWMLPLVAPSSLPSIFCGDMNCDGVNEAYAILKSDRWTDVYEAMAADGTLSNIESRVTGTMPAKKNEEDGLSTWRPDHIFTYGLTPAYYKVNRDKLPTKDGSYHWPSDHLPVTAIVSF